MKTAYLPLIALLATPALASETDLRRDQCVTWMMSGYPSGLEETSCTAQYSLPSPFLFKCVRAERLGYETRTQQRACRVFLEEASSKVEQGYVRSN